MKFTSICFLTASYSHYISLSLRVYLPVLELPHDIGPGLQGRIDEAPVYPGRHMVLLHQEKETIKISKINSPTS